MKPKKSPFIIIRRKPPKTPISNKKSPIRPTIKVGKSPKNPKEFVKYKSPFPIIIADIFLLLFIFIIIIM